jgi:hypothetical protein
MRRGLPLFVLAFVLPAVPAKADGRQVSYVAGTFKEIRVGCKGTLDARDPKELLINCGGDRLEIPTSGIVLSRIVESQRDAVELGLSNTMITRRKNHQLVYIRTATGKLSFTWVLLELPANYAQDLVAYLIRMREDRDTSNAKP